MDDKLYTDADKIRNDILEELGHDEKNTRHYTDFKDYIDRDTSLISIEEIPSKKSYVMSRESLYDEKFLMHKLKFDYQYIKINHQLENKEIDEKTAKEEIDIIKTFYKVMAIEVLANIRYRNEDDNLVKMQQVYSLMSQKRKEDKLKYFHFYDEPVIIKLLRDDEKLKMIPMIEELSVYDVKHLILHNRKGLTPKRFFEKKILFELSMGTKEYCEKIDNINKFLGYEFIIHNGYKIIQLPCLFQEFSDSLHARYNALQFYEMKKFLQDGKIDFDITSALNNRDKFYKTIKELNYNLFNTSKFFGEFGVNRNNCGYTTKKHTFENVKEKYHIFIWNISNFFESYSYSFAGLIDNSSSPPLIYVASNLQYILYNSSDFRKFIDEYKESYESS
jgi:hypothetical protein